MVLKLKKEFQFELSKSGYRMDMTKKWNSKSDFFCLKSSEKQPSWKINFSYSSSFENY